MASQPTVRRSSRLRASVMSNQPPEVISIVDIPPNQQSEGGDEEENQMDIEITDVVLPPGVVGIPENNVIPEEQSKYSIVQLCYL